MPPGNVPPPYMPSSRAAERTKTKRAIRGLHWGNGTVRGSILWMVAKSMSHHFEALETITFVGIYRGDHIIPGFPGHVNHSRVSLETLPLGFFRCCEFLDLAASRRKPLAQKNPEGDAELPALATVRGESRVKRVCGQRGWICYVVSLWSSLTAIGFDL